MRRITYLVVGIVLLTMVYLLFWPVPIQPLAWIPPENPGFTAPYSRNDSLSHAELYPLSISHGPEDTALGSDGRIYCGLADGSIVRFAPSSDGDVEIIINTGGRPLGLKFHNDRLYIADAYMGLIFIDDAVAADGHRLSLATDKVNGEKMIFVDDLDIASDGKVWFSDASTRFDLHDNILDFYEQRPTGRLLSWDPETRDTKVHLEGLGFANGVALGPEEAYILVNETMRYRITRYWIKGEKAGQAETFIENLPGLPDNLTYNKNGLFWVALIFPRDNQLDWLLPRPFVRKIILRLPKNWQKSEPQAMAWVIGLDADGKVVHNLQDFTGRYYTVTSVNEEDGYLWLGSLAAPGVARILSPR